MKKNTQKVVEKNIRNMESKEPKMQKKKMKTQKDCK